MSDIRPRTAEAISRYFGCSQCCDDIGPNVEQATDDVLSVLASWLREHAKAARFVAENAPDGDLTGTALWGGAGAALNALADEIDSKRLPEVTS